MLNYEKKEGRHHSFKNPTHLSYRFGFWYYRHSVPTKYRPILGLTEIRRSLQTRNTELAKWKMNLLDSLIFVFFRIVNNALNTSGVVNWVSLKRDLLEKIDNICKYDVNPFLDADPSSFTEMINQLYSTPQNSTQTYFIPLNHTNNNSFNDKSDFDHSSSSFANIPVDSVIFKTGQGSNMLLSEALEHYIQEKRRMKIWKNRTEKAEVPKIRAILNILPDIPMKMITMEHLRFFREASLKLPSNWHKKKIYRNMEIKKILSLEIPDEERKAPRTIVHDLELFRGFLNWASRSLSGF